MPLTDFDDQLIIMHTRNKRLGVLIKTSKHLHVLGIDAAAHGNMFCGGWYSWQ